MQQRLLPEWPAVLKPSELDVAKSYPGLTLIEVYAEEWGPCAAIGPVIDHLKLLNSKEEVLPSMMFYRAMCTEEDFPEALHDSCPSFYLFLNGSLFEQLRGAGLLPNAQC